MGKQAGKSMTIRELAKRLGVSPATVSIVLNGKQGVSEQTRKRVLEAIEAYHYTPAVRGGKRSKSVLLLKYCKSGMFVEENQGFITMIIDSIAGRLRKKHLGMTMMVAKKDLEEVLDSIDYSKHCGMIVIATEITKEGYALLRRIPIPFVVVDNTMPQYEYSTVCMNNHENVRMALEHCKDCGHRSIGYLGSVSETENFNARRQAFQMCVSDLGLHFEEHWRFLVTPTLLGAHDDFVEQLIPSIDLPSCFFAENDTIALGAMKALKEKGYRIPEEISVIGFDDIPYSSISSPALTTVHVQRSAVGRQAVFQLLESLEGASSRSTKTQITGYLVIRDSVMDCRPTKKVE